jgi:hypothetical protein
MADCFPWLSLRKQTLTHFMRVGHVTVKVAHGNLLPLHLTRLGYCSGVAALLIFFGCGSLQSANAQIRLAQATSGADSGNATANDVITGRGFWQGVPGSAPAEVSSPADSRVSATAANPPPAVPATPPARRAVTSAGSATPAKSTPWPVKDPEPFPNALSYAAQPSPMATRALQTAPVKPHLTAHGDTTVAVKQSDEHAPAASPRNEAAVSAAPGLAAKQSSSPSVVRVGDRFNDPWMRAVIVTPSAHDYMETTLFGVPDFRNLGAYLEKPATAVAVAFADDPHPGMATERFAGNPVTFVPTVSFSASRAPSRR